MNLDRLQDLCREFLSSSASADCAHDVSHVKRVVKNTLYLTDIEECNALITLPSAWLHDCVTLPKDDPLLTLPDTMQTEAGRAEARRRAGLMHGYLDNLRAEIL